MDNLESKYDLIIGNGCSFTEGGGLNHPDLYEFFSKEKFITHEISDKWMFTQAYPKILGDLFNSKWKNISTSCSSNNLIIERAYKELKKHRNLNKVLIVNQLSLATRLGFKNGNKYYSYNGVSGKVVHEDVNRIGWTKPTFVPGLEEPFDQYYKNYIVEVFDIDYHWEKISMQMDLFNSWCEKRNIDNYWVTWDEEIRLKNIDRVINPHGKPIVDWAVQNKLRIMDVEGVPHGDAHLSIEGHKQLANIIYEKIR